MAERSETLRALAEGLSEHDAVEDAFLAKSFTDRVLIVDAREETLPEDVRERLAAHDLRGASEVYGDGGRSFAGEVGDAVRHQFVDVRTRDEHQGDVIY